MSRVRPIRERFPPPWRVEPIPAPGYSVVDANGVKLVYIYAPDERQRAGMGGIQNYIPLSAAEALAIARAIARLPDLI